MAVDNTLPWRARVSTGFNRWIRAVERTPSTSRDDRKIRLPFLSFSFQKLMLVDFKMNGPRRYFFGGFTSQGGFPGPFNSNREKEMLLDGCVKQTKIYKSDITILNNRAAFDSIAIREYYHIKESHQFPISLYNNAD